MTNLNVRQLSNGAIFAQYQKGGKAYDAAFADWILFVDWLTAEVIHVL